VAEHYITLVLAALADAPGATSPFGSERWKHEAGLPHLRDGVPRTADRAEELEGDVLLRGGVRYLLKRIGHRQSSIVDEGI